MSNGSCVNGVVVCLVCKQIFGGFSLGNYPLECEMCTENRFKTCAYKYGDFNDKLAEPRYKSYRICPTCVIYLLLGGRK